MRLLAPLLLFFLLTAPPAHAVVKGSPSAHGRFAVRLLGGLLLQRRRDRAYCCRHRGHCARGMRVIAAGRSFGIAGVSHSTVLEDGRLVTVSGDAAILRLAAPLPAEFDAAPIGDGSGDSYTIAGYGTTDERWRDPFGALHEATLVAHGPGELVDPNRTGPIGASACFGDSGGPVLRGGMLVGIVTRATYPSSRLACGHLTRWEPLTVSEPSVASTDPIDGEAASADQPRNSMQQKPVPRTRTRVSAAGVFNLFGVMRVQSSGSAGSR